MNEKSRKTKSSYRILSRDFKDCFDVKPTEKVEGKGIEFEFTPKIPQVEGKIISRLIRPHVFMHWGHERFHSELELKINPVPAIELTFALEGGWKETYHSSKNGESHRRGGEMSLIRSSLLKSHHSFASKSSLHLTIGIQETEWNQWMEEQDLKIRSAWRDFAWHQQRAFLTVPLSDVARQAVEQIVRCPFHGKMRGFALESRCHDLILEWFHVLSGGIQQTPVVHHNDRERIHAAAENLCRKLEHPPSLNELAASVGMSDSTLQRGFKKVFGMTVFDYLRIQRMEYARRLLQEGGGTVLDIAQKVGYQNPSHFASAFSRQFGINPKKFQLKIQG